MAKYKAYPEYRDSGVEWVGEIPSTWNIVHLKHITIIINGSTPSSDIDAFWNGEINWLTPTDLSKKKGRFIYSSLRKITKRGLNSCGASLVPPNTVILSTRAPIGSLALNKISSCTNQGCKSLVCKNDNLSTFLYYWLTILNEQLNNLGRGSTFLELSSEDLGQVKISIPNEKIDKTVCFLNSETAKIDELIDKQHQFIKLLKEKRQAVISHAVTKGLNPDAPMKDSGVDWLGNIPEHWMLKRAKFIFRKMQRPISKHAGIITAFRDGHVTLRQNKRTDGFTFAIKEIGYQGVLKGDLVIHAMDGFAGAIGVSDSNGKCSPVCSVCIPHKKTQVYTSYYGYLVRQLAVTNFIQSLSKGIRERSTEFRFNEFSELPLPIPNYEEQIFIFKYIKRQEEKIDVLLQKQLQQIDLLKERRTALISAAVTGKIDLRDWTPPASSAEASLTAEEATA
ncbi:restriction endonuclease subunit S [Enterobacter asburiae]|uniref:restriction endonuclease subunit S n=1 Tax=Enterobacter cloacae complex TaxID=354276 RepID=UPI000F89BE91|nr:MULTISPECIES: restriction endonuclease subunit S [Enterobacter cloacae complex]MBE4894430.1 restriction endonuclease subunit S [Enterobacter cloacae complex sp. P16RS2]RTP93315.1 restriction endonuclease subunit S [Enterobacter asburiae]